MSAEPGRTAERVCVDHATSSADERRIYLFHLATYDFARRYVRGGRVLDFGCGTGYGDARIAPDCAAVTGVDVSSAAIEHARRTYVADNLDYRVIAPVDQAPLPFADGSFDAVLSFQVIEHVPDPDRYVAEAWRVLDHGGVLIVATPDRRVRLLPGQRPWNRYHLHEYTSDELAEVLGRRFGVVETYGMGGPPGLIGPELARARRTRVATLPFTFPGAPERWRQWGLSALSALDARVRDRRRGTAGAAPAEPRPGADALGDAPREVLDAAVGDYDESSVRIAPGIRPSVNLVMVARKGARADGSRDAQARSTSADRAGTSSADSSRLGDVDQRTS